MPKQHVWDEVSDHITSWLDTEPAVLADLLVGGQQYPFSAKVSEKDKIAYYHQQFFNQDGSPNEEGRSNILNRVGIKGYVQIHDTVKGFNPEAPTMTGDKNDGNPRLPY